MRLGTMPEGRPERTLAPYAEVWCRRFLRVNGQPWEFTGTQKDYLAWWYAIDREGRWLFEEGAFVAPKGAGKSPFAAAVGLFEMLGPCRFNGWDEQGRPKARPVAVPKVQVAAVSEKQGTQTLDDARGMLSDLAVRQYGLKLSQKLVRFRDPRRPGYFAPVASASASLEGEKPTAVLMDEVHHFTEHRNHKLAEVVKRNAAKVGGRALATSNAHTLGAGSYGEALLTRAEALADGLLYLACQAPPDTPLDDAEGLRAGLAEAYESAPWVDLDRIVRELASRAVTVEDFRRFYLSQVVAAEDGWIHPKDADRAAQPDHVVPEGALITLGFDGSVSRDATALIGCEVTTGHVFTLGVWECPDGPEARTWLVPRDEVDDAVNDAFERFDVCGFFADRYEWEDPINRWAEKYGSRLRVKAGHGHSVAFDMRNRTADFVRAAEATANAFELGEISHDGSRALVRHLKNARRRPTRFGIGMTKDRPHSPRKIDAAVTAVLAREARRVAIEKRIRPKGRRVARLK
ncbi:terminase [Kitasatospora sp. NPDC058184]|uniref:terminase n=1 Tax=Kitasatospora sp. NPDC058184 TaxID=3346370 RepID=UPI0036D8F3C6